MNPIRYRTRSVEVEASVYLPVEPTTRDLVTWIRNKGGKVAVNPRDMLELDTPRGMALVYPTDVVVYDGVRKEFHAMCRADFDQKYEQITTTFPEPALSDVNRRILYDAYDDGDGNTITLSPSSEHPGYFVGRYLGERILDCTEHEGVLYSLVGGTHSGVYTVLVGEELTENALGEEFWSLSEARAYVLGLTR